MAWWQYVSRLCLLLCVCLCLCACLGLCLWLCLCLCLCLYIFCVTVPVSVSTPRLTLYTFLCVSLGDGLLDSYEGNSDLDGDGLPNRLDLDSDGKHLHKSLPDAPFRSLSFFLAHTHKFFFTTTKRPATWNLFWSAVEFNVWISFWVDLSHSLLCPSPSLSHTVTRAFSTSSLTNIHIRRWWVAWCGGRQRWSRRWRCTFLPRHWLWWSLSLSFSLSLSLLLFSPLSRVPDFSLCSYFPLFSPLFFLTLCLCIGVSLCLSPSLYLPTPFQIISMSLSFLFLPSLLLSSLASLLLGLSLTHTNAHTHTQQKKGDGILDALEGDNDFDNDQIPNYLDLDSDGLSAMCICL